MYKLLLFCILTGSMLVSCQKQSASGGNASLTISADTVRFDTVFTATTGITQKVMLINNNNQSLSITDITLMGGTNSSFILNIDGAPGPQATNLNIQDDDSLYIFVSVFVRPTSTPLPFILQDSIRIRYNGTEQYIQLRVWGQNAHFLTNEVVTGNIVWTNDLPYVIFGGLRIDSNASLTIQPGTHIYFHADAAFRVDGSLQVLGQATDSQRIYFNGDRLDQPYATYPGSWPGILFGETSHNNVLNYAVLENSYQTIISEGLSQNATPKLLLNQCIIDNAYANGIIGIQSSIQAVNCLISNCGQNITIELGGIYNFEQCTIASFSTDLLAHQQPVLSVSNAATNGTQIFTGDLQANFSNSIFWGSDGVADEVEIAKAGNTIFQVLFDHTILKQQNYPGNIDSSSLFLNIDPLFVSTSVTNGNFFNFHLQPGSPAIDIGANLGISTDLDGQPRPLNLPDLGCYEHP
jgi:hypothetical protein